MAMGRPADDPPRPTRDDLIAMSHLTLREVAEKYDVSREAVRHWYRDQNVERRNHTLVRGEARREETERRVREAYAGFDGVPHLTDLLASAGVNSYEWHTIADRVGDLPVFRGPVFRGSRRGHYEERYDWDSKPAEEWVREAASDLGVGERDGPDYLTATAYQEWSECADDRPALRTLHVNMTQRTWLELLESANVRSSADARPKNRSYDAVTVDECYRAVARFISDTGETSSDAYRRWSPRQKEFVPSLSTVRHRVGGGWISIVNEAIRRYGS